MHKPAFDYPARCRRIQERLGDAGTDYLLVVPSSDLLYLMGLNRPQTERLTLFMLPREGTPRLIIPEFERALAEPLATFFDILTWQETEDPAQLFASTLPDAGVGLKLAVAGKMFTHFLFRLRDAAPDATFVAGSSVMDPVRMQKEPQELEYLAAAGAAADRVYYALLDEPFVGKTEIELKARVLQLLTEQGHDTAGGAIVGIGENGASPHHHVTDRRAKPGDAVVVDFGGSVRGYWSDMTRTIHIGEPSGEFSKVYQIVNEANQKAFEAVRPGVTAASIDAVARGHITSAGYGDAFLHRTGHGLGMDIHEMPYIVATDDTILQEGMVFSIEPGIYLRGRFGVRIEDIVVVTDTGALRFNDSPHTLHAVEG
jgi:D-alanyl-D-alanine dipeptidase